MGRFRRRSRVERLRDRGDVRRLVRRLGAHDWLVARDGTEVDLAVGQRVEAVVALGEIGTEEAEAGVVRAIEDPDVRVRRAAVEALRPSPGTWSLGAVARAAAQWTDPAASDLREAAIDLLEELGDELSAIEYAQALADDAKRSSLDGWEQDAVRRLFAAHSGIAAEVLAGQLTPRLAADDDAARRAWQVLVAMGEVSIAPLVAALDDPACSAAAAAALGSLRDARAVGPLTRALEDGDPNARAAAALALGAIRDPRAVHALVRACADADADVRDAAMDGLDRMRSVVLAMLGEAALEPDGLAENAGQGHGAAPPGDDPLVGEWVGPPTGADRRSLVRRLLDGPS